MKWSQGKKRHLVFYSVPKAEEQIELLQLDKSGIKVAQYMTELPPRDVLVQQIQKSLEVAKAKWGNDRKEDEV